MKGGGWPTLKMVLPGSENTLSLFGTKIVKIASLVSQIGLRWEPGYEYILTCHTVIG